MRGMINYITGYEIKRSNFTLCFYKRNRHVYSDCSKDFHSWSYALEMKSLIELHDINMVIDVGGNVGQFGAFLRSDIGYTGHIMSFEPNKAAYKELCAKAEKDNKWSAYNMALGRRDSAATLHVPEDSSLGSFFEPNNCSKDIFGSTAVVIEKEKVEVKKSDIIFELMKILDNNLPNILLKLDTQGYDLEVVKGLGDKVKNITLLQSEISVIPIYTGMPTWLESLSYLQSVGFGTIGLYPVSRDNQSFRIIEYDGLFVNDGIAALSK